MIETKVTKMMEISYGKEESEVLDKAASILIEIVNDCYREGFSNGLIENSAKTINYNIGDIEEIAHILENFAESYIFTIKN